MQTHPNGVSRRQFNKALAEFRRIVGDAWVFSDDDDINMYRDAYSPARGEPSEIFAGAAVAPFTVEEVQAIARIANKYRVPLYPISTGRNLGYGGSAPVFPGSIVLDLKRMNRILELDEDHAYALVEPGVSYFDLGRAITEKGYKLWVAAPAPGWGSVVGNSLDRGIGGAGRYSDHFGSHSGMEIVLADGTLVRTGMGAMPNSKTWQQYAWGIGPWVDGLFAQSNFGIVTKMGFQLMREPQAMVMGTVSVPLYSDIHQVLRIYNEWVAQGFLSTMMSMSPLVMKTREESFAQEYPEFHRVLTTGNGPTVEQWNQFARDTRLAAWSFMLRFDGPEEVCQASWAYASRRLAEIPGASIPPARVTRFGEQGAEAPTPPTGPAAPGGPPGGIPAEMLKGQPSLAGFTDGTRVAGYSTSSLGHIWFSPLLPADGAQIIKAREVFTGLMNKYGFKPMNPDLPNITDRSCILIYGFRISDDPEQNRRVRECFQEGIKLGAENGWGEYRTHTMFMDDVIGTFSFNDHALLRLQERIKDALDPNGILSAGRYGIWPRHLRKA